MSEYLSRLKARRAEKQPPEELTKLTKGASVSFVSADPACFPAPQRWDAADIDERVALVTVDGNVPETFAEIMREIPPGVPAARWHQFADDAGRFLDLWGHQAAALGWTAADLFGMDAAAPLARYDRLGLLWLLQGRVVRLIDATSATLAGGLVYRRIA